jgi:lysophospholipase L1-like esterase
MAPERDAAIKSSYAGREHASYNVLFSANGGLNWAANSTMQPSGHSFTMEKIWSSFCTTGLIIVAALCGGTKTFAQDGHWTGTWGCAIQMTEPRNLPPPPGLAGNMLRQIVHVSIGGKQLRIRFSNIFGTNDVVLRSVHVALNPGTTTSGVIDPATDRALTFGGSESTVIPAGKDIWSDPVAFDLPPLANLAITIAFGGTSGDVTGHPGSRTDSYLLPGNAVTSPNLDGAVTTEHWYYIGDVDVLADSRAGSLVAFGDSITDGRGSTTGGNNRWPDDLAARLHTNAPTARVGVVNAGIGGNAIFGGLGPAAVKRFDRDVLSRSGVRWVMIFEGVNDIGGARGMRAATLAMNLISAYTQFADKAHAQHLRIYGATITPFGGNSYYSPAHEAIRQEVNAWIRTNSVYDGVVDFDAAVRDPVTLTNFQSAFYHGVNANDGLHMNPAGYHALADAVDLRLFTK